MNKEKIANIKNKLKENAFEITFFSAAATTVAVSIYSIAKQVNAANGAFEPLPMVDRDEQKKLMEDDAFGLYKLTDDEYMFARIITD